MGLLVLHSAHYAKIFKRLLGTPCDLRWRNEGERELVWTVDPVAPDRGGRAEPDRDRRAGDVRRAVRDPGARRAGLHLASPAARCSAAAARGRAARGGSSTSAPATRTTPSTTTRTSSGVLANGVQWAAPRLRHGARRQPEVAGGVVASEGRRRRRRLGRPAAHRGLRGARRRRADRDRRARGGRARARSPRSTASRTSVARWEDLLELDGLEAISVAVPTFLHAPIASPRSSAGCTCSPRSRSRSTARRRSTMVAAARAAGRVLDVAFNHRRRGDVQQLRAMIEAGRLGRPYYAKAWWLRRTGIPKLGSWFTAPSSRAAGRWSTSACTCSTTRCSCSATRRVRRSARRPTTCSGATASAVSRAPTRPAPTATRKFDVEDLATVFMRLDDGGTLLLEASWAAHRATATSSAPRSTAPRAAPSGTSTTTCPVGSLKLFGDDDGVATAETLLQAEPGGAHRAVVAEFVGDRPLRRLGGARRQRGGTARAHRRRLLPSAREQREITLEPARRRRARAARCRAAVRSTITYCPRRLARDEPGGLEPAQVVRGARGHGVQRPGQPAGGRGRVEQERARWRAGVPAAPSTKSVAAYDGPDDDAMDYARRAPCHANPVGRARPAGLERRAARVTSCTSSPRCSVGFIGAPARSQLYAVLKRLEGAGLVSGRHVVQADRPDKRPVPHHGRRGRRRCARGSTRWSRSSRRTATGCC